MTSFLNKKSSLVLLILSLMIITVSISAASAATWSNSTIEASFSDGNNTTGIQQLGDTLVINGAYNKTTFITNGTSAKNSTPDTDSANWTNSATVNVNNTTTYNGKITIYVADVVDPATKLLSWRFFDYIYVTTTDGKFTYNFDTSLKMLGPIAIALIDETADQSWIYNILQRNISYDGNNSSANQTNNLSFNTPSGVPIQTGNGDNASNISFTPTLSTFIKAKLDTFVVKGVNVRIGQVATFTVTVKGPNVINAGSTIELENVTVIVTLPDGDTRNVNTDANGTGTFTWLVSKMNFEISAKTDLTATNVSTLNIGNVTTPNITSFPYDTFYNDTNGSWEFTAGKGSSNVTRVWFDSPWGYVIGQTAIIFWNIEDVIVDYNKTVTLFYFDKDNLQRTERVPAFTNYTGNHTNVSGHWVTNFTQTHDELTVVVLFPEDTEYYRSDARNTTFVDPSNTSRRTTIEVNYPSAGLKVGVQSDIEIRVKDYQGNYVQSGQVTILWDDQWEFSTDIITTAVVNGAAFFTHTYTQAGAARKLTISFPGDSIGNRGSTYTNVSVPVAKGNVNIQVTQNPLNPIVGEEVIVGAAINNIAIGGSPKYVTFNFVENGVTLHSSGQIAIDKVTDYSGNAQYAYTYILPHTALTINAVFSGDKDYNDATGTLANIIVSPAPTV